MKLSQRRLLALGLSIVGVLLVSTLLYMAGMSALEGKSRGFWRSLEWAAETLSTTGYGADDTWHHPLMVVFVVLVQFTGVFLVFLVFPIYLIPFLEERFETRLPGDCADARDHVLVFRNGPAIATLVEELKLAEVTPIIIEADEAEARRAQEAGTRVVFGSLEGKVMQRVALAHARALILNDTDHRNAAIAITARQLGYTGSILSLVEIPLHRKPTMLAGASAAYTPRHVLGAVLAARASRKVNPTVAGIQKLGDKLQISEVRIHHGSILAGQTLAQARIGETTGVTVIGQWVGGNLIAQPSPDMRIEPGGILIIAGSTENIQQFMGSCQCATPLRHEGPFFVVGAGEVGRKVVELLHDAGEQTHLISRDQGQGVDTVGNVLDSSLLEDIGIRDAQGVVLAVDDDSVTLFATVILKDLAPHVPVIVRVNDTENIERIHGAGAEFALSTSQVTGQILARKLLGKHSVLLDESLKVTMVSSPALAGKHPSELRIRTRTGCSVVAVERGGDLLVHLDRDFRFAANDRVYICGSEQATKSFAREFPER